MTVLTIPSPRPLTSEQPVATPEPNFSDPSPLVRASNAWTALRVSPVLRSMAAIGRGVELGKAPRQAICARHHLGPLVASIVGPAAGPFPPDAAEEFNRRASDVSGVSRREWLTWARTRSTPELLEDVTALIHSGSCSEGADHLACRCPAPRARAVHPRVRRMPAEFGVVPVLIPDPSGRTDPWHEALVGFVATFRGRGTEPASRYSSQEAPSVNDRKCLYADLERLANAFAGPRRVDRMAGLRRVPWSPPGMRSPAWLMRERATATDQACDELLGRLAGAVWP